MLPGVPLAGGPSKHSRQCYSAMEEKAGLWLLASQDLPFLCHPTPIGLSLFQKLECFWCKAFLGLTKLSLALLQRRTDRCRGRPSGTLPTCFPILFFSFIMLSSPH